MLVQIPPRPGEVRLRKLLDVYEVADEGYRSYLAGLARRVNERGWWQKYAGLIGSEYADLIGLEGEVRAIRSYEQELVPGLLHENLTFPNGPDSRACTLPVLTGMDIFGRHRLHGAFALCSRTAPDKVAFVVRM